jgi:hypothetical protein
MSVSIRTRTLSVLSQVMRPRRVVPKIPPKSSVPPGLPLYKIRPLLTHSESTLLQVLIPLHFNSLIINTYKKPGGGCPSLGPKVLQLVTTRFFGSSPFNFKPSTLNLLLRHLPASFPFPLSVGCKLSAVSSPASPFPATLASHLQIAENKTTLSPAVATLTDCVKHKSFVCHSCTKHGGWGVGSHLSNEGFSSLPANFADHGSRDANSSSRPLLAANSSRIRTYEKKGGRGATPPQSQEVGGSSKLLTTHYSLPATRCSIQTNPAARA